MSLLTPKEAANHLSSTNTINPSLLCEPINLAEIEFSKCFELLYSDMMSSAKNNIPTAYTSYNPQFNYAINDIVMYEQLFYKSLIQNNGFSLSDTTKWEELPKFDNDCFNSIWCHYVKPAIAALTAYHAISRLTHQLTNNGLVSKKIDGNNRIEETIDGKYFFERKNYEKGLFDDYVKQLRDYIKKNAANSCWDKYQEALSDRCGESKSCGGQGTYLGLIW